MAAGLMKKKETQDGRPILGKSIARYVRVAPRKARIVIDLIREKPVYEALEILEFTQRPSAVPFVQRALKAAVASAGEVHPEPQNLIVAEAIVDEAPMMKRIRAASMGRAVRIRKRASHIYIALAEEV